MYRLTVLYMHRDGAKFDFDYYAKKHMPMVCGHIGKAVVRFEVAEGLPDQSGKPAAVQATGQIYVTDLGAVAAAMQKHGAAILDDIKNYTTIAPVMVSEKMIVP